MKGLVKARCPNPSCGAELLLPPDRLGKNAPCPSCGQVITARPLAVTGAEGTVNGDTEKTFSCPHSRGDGASSRASRVLIRRDLMPVSLVLEDVRSLWNVGSIFRTADAAGAEELWLCGITGRPPRKEIAKTALGAEGAVPWCEASSALEAVDALRRRGRFVIALESSKGSRLLDEEAPVKFPCALVLGNEVAGVSEAVLRRADLACRISMHGVKASLNVAVAAGVALYALRRLWGGGEGE